MSPTLKAILLGAALATASPIAHNATLPHQNTVSLATLLPDGIAPVFMSQVADPAGELEKCNIGLYLACTSIGGEHCGPLLNTSGACGLDRLVKQIVGSLPLHVDLSSPITVDDSDVVSDKAIEAHNASAPALERRQSSSCAKSCAAWAALPPFGMWFGICVADCKGRCARHAGHCP
ncbi:hypothetical protein F5883DRAFT_647972 [Diaporthe sp. PMI_573]|nr:hypothetical protein F5883DRAFT_647972 [Diaporthaceae sp. PMI_573]